MHIGMDYTALVEHHQRVEQAERELARRLLTAREGDATRPRRRVRVRLGVPAWLTARRRDQVLSH